MELRLKDAVPVQSELVNPREFMRFWSLEAYEACRIKPTDEATIQKNIAAKMNISSETVAELGEVCGKKSLFCGNEPKRKDQLYKVNELPPNVELQSLKAQLESNKMRQERNSFHWLIKSHMKYKAQDAHLNMFNMDSTSKDIPQGHRVPVPNVVLTVQVKKCLLHGDHGNGPKEMDTYLVLGSQALTELRDKINCTSDKIIPGDYSLLPDVDPRSLQTTGEMYKSSFFLFEDVFYNDMRESDNKDYSTPIIEWAKEHMPDRTFITKDMSQATFFDLSIRLGRHYLYTHQGNCEHSVMFTDIRLFNATDPQDKHSYPFVAISRTHTRIVCVACYTFTARWSVSNTPLIPNEPTLLCGNCFKSLLYTKDGKKISDFKAHHFVC